MLTQPPLTSSVVKATASKVFSSAPCTLTWRDRKLFVRAASLEESLDLEALQDSDRLVECLRRSPVELVKLDSSLNLEALTEWAEACLKAKKTCYVSTPTLSSVLMEKSSTIRSMQELLSAKSILVVTFLIGPIGCMLANFLKYSDWKIEKQWVVGKQGRIFQILHLEDLSKANTYEYRAKFRDFFNIQLPSRFQMSSLSNLNLST